MLEMKRAFQVLFHDVPLGGRRYVRETVRRTRSTVYRSAVPRVSSTRVHIHERSPYDNERMPRLGFDGLGHDHYAN